MSIVHCTYTFIVPPQEDELSSHVLYSAEAGAAGAKSAAAMAAVETDKKNNKDN